jgi:hypothetical protein
MTRNTSATHALFGQLEAASFPTGAALEYGRMAAGANLGGGFQIEKILIKKKKVRTHPMLSLTFQMYFLFSFCRTILTGGECDWKRSIHI